MKIEYKNTFEELLNYEELRHKKNKILNIYQKFLDYFFILAVVYVYIKYVIYIKGITFWLLTIFIFVLPMGLIKGKSRIQYSIDKKYVKSIIKRYPQLIQAKNLEIDENIMKITNKITNNSINITKDDVGEIVEVENSIYLISGKEKNPLYPLAMIPLNIFEKEEDKEKFLLLLNEFR